MIGLVFTAVEAAALVQYVTRFTREIFAVLIATIYIADTFIKLAEVRFPYRS